MKNWQLIQGLESYLSPLVSGAMGNLEVAKSLKHAHEMLAEAPREWKLILHYEGLSPHPQSREGMTFHRVATVIQQQEGLQINRGAPIYKNPVGSEPMLQRVEQVSSWMRALKFPDGLEADCAGFSLEEADWVETHERTLAISLSWQLEAALPHFSENVSFTIPT